MGSRFPEVLAGARDGEEWAWSELYRWLAPELLRFLDASGADDPENCLGDTFVALVRRLPQFDGDEAGLRALAFTVARSRLVDAWRRAGRRPRETDLDGVAEPSTPPADVDSLDRAAIESILSRLGEDQRAVVVLRLLHGFSVRQTAEILGRSEGAIKQLQHRAITSLRQVIPGELPIAPN